MASAQSALARAGLGALCALGLLLASVPVRAVEAQPAPAGTPSAPADSWRLDWRAPASCPTSREVELEIAHRLTQTDGQLQVTAQVAETAAGFHVELRFSGAVSGVRELEGPSCPALARAVVLIVILALDPNAATSLSERLRAEPAFQAPAVVPPPAPPAPPAQPQVQPKSAPDEPASSTEPGLQVNAAAGLLAEVGWVPGLGFGAIGSLGLVAEHWSAAALGGGVPSTSLTGSAADGAAELGASLGWAFAGARACLRQAWKVELSACGQARATWLQVEGTGGSQAQHSSAFVLLLEPGLMARLPGPRGVLQAFGLELGAFLTLPTRNQSFVFRDESTTPPSELEVFRLGPGAHFALSVDLRF